MKNATSLAAAEAARIVQTSNEPKAILKAWEAALELLPEVKEYKLYGTKEEVFSMVDTDENVTIALTGWTMNPATPAEVIEAFWKNPEVRLMVDGVWGGVLMETVALPNTPDEIRKEIAESWQRLWDRHWKTSGKE